MRTYRIWTLWGDLSEDTGARIVAASPDDALASAHRQGLDWGLGYQWPRYQGMHAQEVTT
jgi:hypothetical protein